MSFFSTGYTATDMLASVATGAQTTIADMGPIATTVVGIIIGFVVLGLIVSLFKRVKK